MSKKTVLISFAIFIVSLAIIFAPSILPVFGVVGNSTTFNVTLTVNSGTPTITYVDAISDGPSDGTTKVVHFYFNATHPNGVSNIPFANATVRINLTTEVLTSSSCSIASTTGITNRFDCSVTLNYNNSPGTWTINATITDLASNVATNLSQTYTNANLWAITLRTNSITFAGTPGQSYVSSPNPQQVNNTGNKGFAQINVTAFNLQSATNATNIIGAGNITANTTDGSGAGHALINNTAITLANSALTVSGSKNMYLYMNIPAGVANGTYNSVSPWTVTVS